MATSREACSHWDRKSVTDLNPSCEPFCHVCFSTGLCFLHPLQSPLSERRKSRSCSRSVLISISRHDPCDWTVQKKKGVWETSVKIPQMHQKMRKEKWRVTCYMTSVLCLQEKKRTHPEKPLVELNDFLVVRSIRARNVNCNLKESTEQFPRPHIWNSLPQDLRFRNCSTLSSFKARLKTILFSVFPPQLILIPSFCYSQCVCVCVCVHYI